MNWKCILVITVIVFFVFGRCSEGFEAPKLNIYGEPLVPCRKPDSNDGRGKELPFDKIK